MLPFLSKGEELGYHTWRQSVLFSFLTFFSVLWKASKTSAHQKYIIRNIYN